MIFHNVEQRHIDWFKLHIGRITASGLDNFITPEWKLRTGETPKSYVAKKAAEAYRGYPILDELNSFAVEQGRGSRIGMGVGDGGDLVGHAVLHQVIGRCEHADSPVNGSPAAARAKPAAKRKSS